MANLALGGRNHKADTAPSFGVMSAVYASSGLSDRSKIYLHEVFANPDPAFVTAFAQETTFPFEPDSMMRKP